MSGPDAVRPGRRGSGAGARRARWLPRRARSLPCWAAACALALTPAASAQTESQVTLKRKDTTIVVTLKARYADGARFIGNNPNCQSGARQTLLYGPDPGYVDTQVGSDTQLRSNVAIVQTPDGNGGGPATGGAATVGAAADTAATGAAATDTTASAPPADRQTLELYNGTITLSRPGCVDTEQRTQGSTVTLIQGRTTVKGSRFFLDQGADTGIMDGPIELTRAAAGDAPGLTASADSMRFDTQTRHATLLGNVKVTSDERVTSADSLELDEAAGIALLAGSPARSVKGKDVLEGSRLRYYLDTNDVVVLGQVHGELDVSIP